MVEDAAVQTSLVGKQIGNYVVSKLLGEGGMGAVYLASHPDIGLDVAIKVLRPELCDSKEAADRFINEAKAVTRINHPNIIRISDFGRLDNGHLYYVMEALSGEDLGQVLERERLLPAEQVLAYLEQVCPALQTAHDSGVIHRDLKPDNLFVVCHEPLSVKILDFGLAKLLQNQHQDGIRTSAGIVMGTPLYIAPEQAAGDVDLISSRTDLYSLGVIVYQMLSGKLPITGKTTSELLFKQVSAPAKPLREVAPQISPALAEAVHRCMEKDSDKRPPTATAMLDSIRAAIEASGQKRLDGAQTKVGDPIPARPAPEAHSVVGVSAPELETENTAPTPAADAGDASGASVPMLSLGPPKGPSNERTWRVATPARPVRRSSKATLVAISTAAVALLGLGGYMLLRQPAKKPPAAGSTVAATSPIKTFSVSIVNADVKTRCQATIDGASETLSGCAPFKVTAGRRLKLTVDRPGYQRFEEQWTVTGDRSITLLPAKLHATATTPPRHRRRPRPKARATKTSRPPATKRFSPPAKATVQAKPSVAASKRKEVPAAPAPKKPAPEKPAPEKPAPEKPAPKKPAPKNVDQTNSGVDTKRW